MGENDSGMELQELPAWVRLVNQLTKECKLQNRKY